MIRACLAVLAGALVGYAAIMLITSCAGADPAAAAWTAERLRCVQREDAAIANAATARACLHDVDRAYGRDGGR